MEADKCGRLLNDGWANRCSGQALSELLTGAARSPGQSELILAFQISKGKRSGSNTTELVYKLSSPELPSCQNSPSKLKSASRLIVLPWERPFKNSGSSR